MKEIRPIRIEGDVAYIALTKGKEAIIDSSDVKLVSGRHWHVVDEKHTSYAKSWMRIDGKGMAKPLHRFLMNPPDGMDVDHIDGNGLNNRRSNLRVCTRSENQRNRKVSKRNKLGLKGVYYCKHNKVFMASIKSDKKYIKLGQYSTPEQAYEAYCNAAKIYHGEFTSYSI